MTWLFQNADASRSPKFDPFVAELDLKMDTLV